MNNNIYYLMNKNNKVLSFIAEKTEFSDEIILKETERFGDVPIGFVDIDTWVDNRKGLKHNAHLKKIMTDLNCDNHEGFIRTTHAANINDCFWTKRIDEDISWEDVSLYQNEFSDVISRLAFEGLGLGDNQNLSPTSPELTCDGSFRKCFIKEDTKGQFGSDIFIYKRRGELDNESLTPYSEMLSSQIAAIISPDNYVEYKTVYLHNKLASKCNLFTNELYGYASFNKLFSNTNRRLEQIFDYYRSIGSEQHFRELLVIDALCFNIDRHRGNFGVVFDNDTLKPLHIAPVFDLNLSMLYSFSKNDFDDVGFKLYDIKPKLGDDFTRIGQIAMNAEIAERVRKLKDFSFDFEGDETFTKHRAEMLLDVILRQANAILDDKQLFVKDVFYSSKTDEYYRQENEYIKAIEILERFAEKIQNEYPSILVSECAARENENEVTAKIIIEDKNNLFEIDFINKSVSFNIHDASFNAISQTIIDELIEFSGYKEFEKYLIFDDPTKSNGIK